jgi:hypothetical protein
MRCCVARLTGVPHTLPPDGLAEPWRALYARLTRARDRREAEAQLHQALDHIPLGEQLAARLATFLPADDRFAPFPSLLDIAPGLPPVEWLWPSWIPRGMLTLFGAAPGAGKSFVALDLARRLIHGLPFPDGAPSPCPGANVLVVDAEGTPALLNQRAEAWHTDRRRLYLMLAARPDAGIDLDSPDDRQTLHTMCRHLQPALVIVDSLGAASAHGESSLEGARHLLGFLAALAADGNLAILIIHHLRKASRLSPSPTAPRIAADDLRGSSHISAAARSVLALTLPPASASPARCLKVVKTNLCPYPPPLLLTLEDVGAAVPRLLYSPAPDVPWQPTLVDLCAGWLLDLLAACGPMHPRDLIPLAVAAGYPRPTLYRARQALAGLVLDLGNSRFDPAKRWTLAPSPPDPPAGALQEGECCAAGVGRGGVDD